MAWHLQLAVGQLSTIGFGKIDAKLKPATHSNHSLVTLKLQLVEIVQVQFHQPQVTLLMVTFVVHNMTDSATAVVTADGAGLLMIQHSGLQLMLIVDAKSDFANDNDLTLGIYKTYVINLLTL